jgi:SAM-dependent methyltransferase
MNTSPFPYATADHENVSCNFCGRNDAEKLHDRDRNGLHVQSVICKHCGLIYISPRMTNAWYGRYYEVEYRAQMARFKNKPLTPQDNAALFKKATQHGRTLAAQLRDHWSRGLTVEVGSSVGGVLNGIREEIGVNVMGIEPSPDETAEANSRGIKTYCALIESFKEPIPLASNILCSQSLNHFLNPRYFFAWSHRHLVDDGKLVLEVMNFRHVFRHFRWMQRAIQVDHTYMFVPEVLEQFVTHAGFNVVKLEVGEKLSKAEIKQLKKVAMPIFHILLVAEKTSRQPFQQPERIFAQYSPVMESLRGLPNSEFRYRLKTKFPKIF